MKKALITGVSGQDGAYLAKYLLSLGYEVYGGYRRSSSVNFWRLSYLNILDDPKFKLIEFELTDPFNILNAIKDIRPSEIYNLAAQSFVGVSFTEPFHTLNATAAGVLNILEAIKTINKEIKFYQASTSEMFGMVQAIPQNEVTPFYPRSPYGVAKLYAHFISINYRESYDIFATSGILFNHESPLRGLEFVTRKITNAVAKIYLNKADKLVLGNLDAKRDWGYAAEYVVGMHAMLQAEKADTFVLATNTTTTVRDFVKFAFEAIDTPIEFIGEGINETGVDRYGKVLVEINKSLFRPAEVDLLIGDASKAKKQLGWEAKTDARSLCEMMVKDDINKIKQNLTY
ncbi:GDP-mannose 4,6-dehydratase [Campylobacter sp. 19-13652]|uniref:GDP-mannose 4,6-dehydratase n=1 Tax=Campylobacter sp. 19-13652 TaxID=2840180 RepID=UPI001C769D90|nr:GDP-mannose 4,6-dehydratase [Campylobacter sp. 19-13652]BCX79967.1 GDP-mannose 4,6-dehydratase [Campylobacter sp. 19-13652]